MANCLLHLYEDLFTFLGPTQKLPCAAACICDQRTGWVDTLDPWCWLVCHCFQTGEFLVTEENDRGSHPGVWASGFLTQVNAHPHTSVHTHEPVHIHTLHTLKPPTKSSARKQWHNSHPLPPRLLSMSQQWVSYIAEAISSKLALRGSCTHLWTTPSPSGVAINSFTAFLLHYFFILVRHTSHKSYHLNTLIQISQGDSVSF